MQEKSTFDSVQTTDTQVVSVSENQTITNPVHNVNLIHQHLIYPILYVGPKFIRSLKDKRPITRRLCFIGKTDEIPWTLRDPGLKNFGKCLTSLYPMQELYLEFRNCDALSRQRWAKFCEELQCLKSLRKITANFTSSWKVSNNALKILGQSLELLPSLRSAAIIFYNIGIDDEGVKHLSKSLKRLALTDLKLDFSKDMHITDKGLRSLSKGLRRLKTLKTLNLDFEGLYKITSEAVKYLSHAFNFLTTISNIQIRFRGCYGILDQGLIYLSDTLKKLTQLDSFGVNFGMCDKITDVGFKELVFALKNLTSLKQLTLRLFICQVSNAGLKTLKETLVCLTHLESLDLEFSLCKHISKEGVEDLGDSLQYLTSLRMIRMAFDSSTNVTDGITKHFKLLTSLREIYLSFGRNHENITDVTLKDLGEGLKSMKSMHTIYLDFTEGWQLTDEGLMEFGQGLATLTSIQVLYLNFPACQKITINGLREFCEVLKKLGSLTRIHLDFKWCKQIAHEGLKALNQELNSIKAPTQTIDIKH